MPNHIILSTLRCIDCIDCITVDECSYLAAGLLYDQNFFGSYPFYKNISYFQADFVLIKMVLYLPNFSLVFLIHVFLYAGVYCMTLYMRKVLTSPQPSFPSMPVAALKYNKQEDSSIRRHVRKLVLICRIKVISCTIFQYLITTAS